MLPVGVKSLVEIATFPDTVVRTTFLGILFEHALKSITPNGKYKKLEVLFSENEPMLKKFQRIEDLRIVRNWIIHGDERLTPTQVLHAESALQRGIEGILSNPDFPPRVRSEVKGVAPTPARRAPSPKPEDVPQPARSVNSRQAAAGLESSADAPDSWAKSDTQRDSNPPQRGTQPSVSKRQSKPEALPEGRREVENPSQTETQAGKSKSADELELLPSLSQSHRGTTIWYGLAGVFLLIAIVIYAVESRSSPHQAQVTAVQAAPVPTPPLAKSQSAPIAEPHPSPNSRPVVSSPIEAKPIDNEAKLKPLINTNLSVSLTKPNLAIIIDSADTVSGFSISDSLREFLNDGRVQLIGNLADVTTLKAAGLFEALYGGDAQLLRQAIQLSGVSHVLLGKSKYSLRRRSELDPDLMTGDLTLTCKLVDRNGTIIRTASIATTGAGFTESLALERAAENAALQVKEGFFDSIR